MADFQEQLRQQIGLDREGESQKEVDKENQKLNEENRKKEVERVQEEKIRALFTPFLNDINAALANNAGEIEYLSVGKGELSLVWDKSNSGGEDDWKEFNLGLREDGGVIVNNRSWDEIYNGVDDAIHAINIKNRNWQKDLQELILKRMHHGFDRSNHKDIEIGGGGWN